VTAVLLDSPPLDVYGQMALDEALLDNGRADFTLRFFRWAPGSRPSATFGYFQRFKEVAASVNGAPLTRRPTGGGIVHHVDDVTFSFAFKWDGTLAPQAIYKNIHRGVHLGLKQTLKLKTALWSPPGWRDASTGLSASAPKCETKTACECFDQPEPMDLVGSDDKKVLGGALRRRAGRVLYQGSLQLPVSAPPPPSGRPPPKGEESSSLLPPLGEVARRADGGDTVELAILRGFEAEWGEDFVKAAAGPEILKEAAVRREQYRSDAWNNKR